MQQLPDKPSELIRLALKDEDKAHHSPKYRVYMNVWHEVYTYKGQLKCHVCFAGAVMAFTLGADWKADLEPEDFINGNLGKLNALDAFRSGEIYDGCKEMKIVQKVRNSGIFTGHDFDTLGCIKISGYSGPSYRGNRLKWRKDMFELANTFAGGGL